MLGVWEKLEFSYMELNGPHGSTKYSQRCYLLNMGLAPPFSDKDTEAQKG